MKRMSTILVTTITYDIQRAIRYYEIESYGEIIGVIVSRSTIRGEPQLVLVERVDLNNKHKANVKIMTVPERKQFDDSGYWYLNTICDNTLFDVCGSITFSVFAEIKTAPSAQ